MTAYAVVDSGTTTTRVRLWQDGAVRWSDRREAGARDTAADGAPTRIRSALRELLAALSRDTGERPNAVICSGMITSNLGLHEVPHLPAPAGPTELARGVVTLRDPELPGPPLALVPGVKTPPGEGWGGLEAGDLLRGEEAEVTGLRALMDLDGPATFLHFGSHHKAIRVDAGGRILGSRSAITGELFAALAGHTILRSGLEPLEGLELDRDAVRAGAAASRRHGVGRAAYLVRVGQQLAGMPAPRTTSFLVGALSALTLPLVEGGGAEGPTVLYGRGAFTEAVAWLLEDAGSAFIRVDAAVADVAAAAGAVRLYELARELGSAP